MLRILTCALLALLTVRAASAKCAVWGLSPIVATAKDALLPVDGAIVVTATPLPNDDGASGDVAVQNDWKLRIDGALVAPKLELVAPGLAIYKPPASLTAAKQVELVDAAGKVRQVVRFDPAAKRPALAAPSIRRVTYSQVRKGRSMTTRVAVTLGRAALPGAIALVLTDDKGVARSWGTPEASLTLDTYSQGRCETLPHGTVQTLPRHKVRFFWVDAAGRRSPASRTFVVGR